MKQRFLNQKLGKRNSRRAEINKAKRVLSQRTQQARSATDTAMGSPAGIFAR